MTYLLRAVFFILRHNKDDIIVSKHGKCFIIGLYLIFVISPVTFDSRIHPLPGSRPIDPVAA